MNKPMKHQILKHNANHHLIVPIMKILFTIKIIERNIIIFYPKGAVNIYKRKNNCINIFYDSPGFT